MISLMRKYDFDGRRWESNRNGPVSVYEMLLTPELYVLLNVVMIVSMSLDTVEIAMTPFAIIMLFLASFYSELYLYLKNSIR